MKKKLLFCLTLTLVFISSAKAQVGTTKTLTKTNIVLFNKTEIEYRQVQKELAQLEQQKKQLLTQMAAFEKQQKIMTQKVEKLETAYNNMTPVAAGGSGQDQLLNATKQMQETQMSFNLQYLQLQSQMQHENRSYTAVSNIMKTKHDTVKNSISNIR
jgi:septal ring factor EnvC (AmiA/AmiB activator)